MKLNKLFLALICGPILSFNLLAQPAFISDSLDQYVKREMQRWQVPGLAIAIVKDGKVVVTKGYGVKNAFAPVKGKNAVSPENNAVNEFTQFQIASNSKAFTGTAINLEVQYVDVIIATKN